MNRSLNLAIKSIDAARRSFDIIASTETIDSYGDVIDQASWRLERYLANPVILFAHQSRELPIGRAENVRVESGALRATVVMVDEKANPIAANVFESVRQGSIRGVSVGFLPRESRYEMRDGTEVSVLYGCELREISIVTVPANPDTLIRSAGAGPRSSERSIDEDAGADFWTRDDAGEVGTRVRAATTAEREAEESRVRASFAQERREIAARHGLPEEDAGADFWCTDAEDLARLSAHERALATDGILSGGTMMSEAEAAEAATLSKFYFGGE